MFQVFEEVASLFTGHHSFKNTLRSKPLLGAEDVKDKCDRVSVVVKLMCQLIMCLDIWSNIVLGFSAGVFLDEIYI